MVHPTKPSAPPSGSAGGDLTGTFPNPTVKADAITYAKIQNVSATSRLLGRSTAGAGDIEELSIGAGLTLAAGVLTGSASGGPVSTPVVIGINQADPAVVTGFTSQNPTLMTATSDANGRLTMTSLGGIGDTWVNSGAPGYARVVTDVATYGMVWRMGLTSALGGVVCGVDGGICVIGGGETPYAQWRLCNDGQGGGPEAIRAVQGAGYVGGGVNVAGLSAGGIWFAIEIVGLMCRFWYNLSAGATEPTTGWVTMSNEILVDANGGGWKERFDILQVTSAVDPVGWVSNIRTIRNNVFGWAQ